MKQINIRRTGNTVTFDTVSIDVTENVFFTNLDPEAAHWPDLTDNQLGAAPSANSNQCQVNPPSSGSNPPYVVTYKCKLHGNEQGKINVFAQLAAANTTLQNGARGVPIKSQQVVVGGMSPYKITGQQFQVTDGSGSVVKSGQGVGPGLELDPTTNNGGVYVKGTPIISGTYNFTFTVNDGMGRNLQQVQYTMQVE